MSPPFKNAVSERALISAIRGRMQPNARAVALGIGDDCALVRPARGEEVAVTTDFSIEGVHFRRDWHAPEQVGHRALARGLSDLAAMGARPLAAFLSLAVPAELTRRRGAQRSWVERFLDGMLALAGHHGVTLAGGDTSQAPVAIADIVLVGGVARGRALLRSQAHEGDLIYVTGALGGAAAELLSVERTPSRYARLIRASPGHPHLFPEPRLAIGRRLALLRLATAAIDLSDGLSTDLLHLCQESHLSAEIDASAIPIHPLAMQPASDGLKLALHGGEDYELLFTAAPGTKMPAKIAGVCIHAIGRMRGPGQASHIKLATCGYEKLEPGGWEHFNLK